MIKYTITDCTVIEGNPIKRRRMMRKAAKLAKKNSTVFEVFTCKKGPEPVKGSMTIKEATN